MFRSFDVTPVCDTSIFASGDLIADWASCQDVFQWPGQCVSLVSLTIIDKDDQGAAFDVYIANNNTTLGTLNSAPSITDAGTAFIQAVVPVATTDWKDLGGARVANIKNIWSVLDSVASGTNLYVGIVNGSGTPTYTASGLVLRLGVNYA